MERRIAAGLVAGLIAGIVFTVVGPFLTTLMPGGESTSMLSVAAEALHAHGRLAGWVACVVYTVVIGGIFGWLVSSEPPDGTRLTLWGGLYGLAWWIVSGLVLIPALLAKVPLSSSALDATRARGAGVPDRARAVRRDSRLGLHRTSHVCRTTS